LRQLQVADSLIACGDTELTDGVSRKPEPFWWTPETPGNISLSFRPMGWFGNIGICSHGAVLIGEGSRRILAVFGRFLSKSRLRKDESNRGDSQEQRESR
jgi:hypothetical protein